MELLLLLEFSVVRRVSRATGPREQRIRVFVRVGGFRRSPRVSRDTPRGASSNRIGLDGTSTKTESRILTCDLLGACAFSFDTNDSFSLVELQTSVLKSGAAWNALPPIRSCSLVVGGRASRRQINWWAPHQPQLATVHAEGIVFFATQTKDWHTVLQLLVPHNKLLPSPLPTPITTRPAWNILVWWL